MGFDVSRLGRAERIVGGGAIAFFIFLFFFHWYGYSSNVPSIGGVNLGGSISRSGWDTFTNSRWIWLITIIVALVAVAVSAGTLKLESPVSLSVLVTGLGALSTLLILYRIVHHPTASASFGAFHASVGIKIGIWLGLIAAAAVTYGGYLGMQAEGTSLADVREQARDAIGGMTAPAGPTAQASPSGATESAAPAGSPATPPGTTPSSEKPASG